MVPSPKAHSWLATCPSGSLAVESKVADLPTTSGPLGASIPALGASLGSSTAILTLSVAVAPASSVTVSVTVYRPPAPYEWVAVAPVAVVPSPNSHW